MQSKKNKDGWAQTGIETKPGQEGEDHEAEPIQIATTLDRQQNIK